MWSKTTWENALNLVTVSAEGLAAIGTEKHWVVRRQLFCYIPGALFSTSMVNSQGLYTHPDFIWHRKT